VQDIRPKLDCTRGQFGNVVERSERQRPPYGRCEVRQWIVHFGRKAEDGVWQPHDAFRAEVICFWRRDHGISDQPVDVGNACRAGIAEETRLHRCHALGKGAQSPSGGMACKIDEDVDLIGVNAFGQLRGVHVAPRPRPAAGETGLVVHCGSGIVDREW